MCAMQYDLLLEGYMKTKVTLAWTQPLTIKDLQGSRRSGCALDLVKITQVPLMEEAQGTKLEQLRRR